MPVCDQLRRSFLSRFARRYACHRGPVNAVKYADGGNYVVTASCGRVDVWDVRGGTRPNLTQSTKRGTGRGRRRGRVPLEIVGGGGLSRLRVLTPLEPESRDVLCFSAMQGGDGEVVRRMQGHLGPVLDFDRGLEDGRMVTVGEDGMILVWGYREGRGRKRPVRQDDEEEEEDDDDNWDI